MTSARNQAFAFMGLGFGLWMLAFALLYGVQGAGCALGWQDVAAGPVSLLRLALAAIWAAHMAALGWLFLRCRQALSATHRQEPLDLFLWKASTWLTVAALAATIWIGIAVLVPSIC